jgi:hypothetical protein
MPTKTEIQQWAREEWARLDQEKTERAQAACDHAREGVLKFGKTFCRDCDAEVTMDDATRSGPTPAPDPTGLNGGTVAQGRMH